MSARLDPETTDWLVRQRWFAAKTRRIAEAVIEDRIPVERAEIDVVRVMLDDGSADRYVLARAANAAVRDAFDDPSFCRALLRLMGESGEARGERGVVRGSRARAFPAAPLADGSAVRRLSGEQSNTSVVFDGAVIVKHFRRLTDGENPELEITRFLTEHTPFRNTPRLAGALEYVTRDGITATMAVAQELVVGARDGWQWLLARLAAGDGALDTLQRLGQRTGELHLALATPTSDPAFGAETIGRDDVARWTAAVERQIAGARAAVPGRGLPEVPAAAAAALAGLLGAAKIRHHGDFHLGQTLCVRDGDDFMLIDFEGEPLRPLAERRRKHTPLRDVAGMLRSFAYAAATTARSGRSVGDWESSARVAFVDGYRAVAGGAPFVPAADAFARAVAALELEKAAYEIVYEANNRPDWVEIPLRGFVNATASLARVAGAA